MNFVLPLNILPPLLCLEGYKKGRSKGGEVGEPKKEPKRNSKQLRQLWVPEVKKLMNAHAEKLYFRSE